MPKAKINHNYILTFEKCSYCKTNLAIIAYSNGKFCCEENYTSCPEIRKKNSKSEKWFLAMKNKKNSNQYIKAKELGLEKPKMSEETKQKLLRANTGRTHTEETKQKLSKIRKDFLLKNPDKVPYKLNHYSKGPSYPEKYFTELFIKENIIFETEKQVGLYSLDFTFPNTMIDLEINGEQHYVDNRIVESDKRRAEYLKGIGYTILIIRWSEYQKLDFQNKTKIIDKLKEIINSLVRPMGLEPTLP